jgi:oligosaccharide translocation protein RFT1
MDSQPQAPLLGAAAKGAQYQIILQILFRAATFGVNQILLRYLTPETLGISVQLELYLISILYFSRETLRVAVQRQPAKAPGPPVRQDEKANPMNRIDSRNASGQTQAVVNLSYIAIGLGIPLAYIFHGLYIRSVADTGILETPYFYDALKLYGFAAVMELLTEPFFVVVQHLMLYKVRAYAEGSATMMRCAVTIGTALLGQYLEEDVGVYPFAAGQMAYASTLIMIYCYSLWSTWSRDGFTYIASPIYSPYVFILRQYNVHLLILLIIISVKTDYLWSYLSRPLLNVGMSMYLQSAIKHFLTQGDSIIIALFSTLSDQGVYALASNYGGLVARMVFQPIEESSRNLFAKLLSTSNGPKDGAKHENKKDFQKPAKEQVKAATDILTTILRLYTLLSLFAISLGPTIAPKLLTLVAGSRWTSTGAGPVLSVYCYYIPLLALNGISEAFISSVATPKELQIQSAWMFVFTAGFAGAGYLFLGVLGWGAKGLVVANCVNMLLRIVWSSNFIGRYLGRNGEHLDLGALLPSVGSITSGVVAWGVLQARENAGRVGLTGISKYLTETNIGLIESIAVAGVMVAITLFFEREYLKRCWSLLRAGKA